jgi:hypothetical protein
MSYKTAILCGLAFLLCANWPCRGLPARRRRAAEPYTIGFLQWNGEEWVDQVDPAFVVEEEWEHQSVYEPNLIDHDDRPIFVYVKAITHSTQSLRASGWAKTLLRQRLGYGGAELRIHPNEGGPPESPSI